MTITNRAIAQKIFEALRDSAEILAECDSRFAKAHTVCLGISGKQGPPPADCPVFEVISWGKDRAEIAENRSFIVSVNLFLEDSQSTEAETAAGVKTITQQGPESLEVLLDLVQAAAVQVFADLQFEEMTFAYDAVEYFPLFAGTLSWLLTFPNLGGGYEASL